MIILKQLNKINNSYIPVEWSTGPPKDHERAND